LETVLQPAEEPVGLRQRVGVRGGHEPLLGQGPKGGEGSGRPQPGVSPPAHQLQELDGEFDVPDPAPSSLELDGLLAPGQNALPEPSPSRAAPRHASAMAVSSSSTSSTSAPPRSRAATR